MSNSELTFLLSHALSGHVTVITHVVTFSELCPLSSNDHHAAGTHPELPRTSNLLPKNVRSEKMLKPLEEHDIFKERSAMAASVFSLCGFSLKCKFTFSEKMKG